jgi:hypothetical protein
MTASDLAHRVRDMLPPDGTALADETVRRRLCRRIRRLSTEQYRAAVVLGRARGDFVVLADYSLARRPAEQRA